jgi:hypothetical protein
MGKSLPNVLTEIFTEPHLHEAWKETSVAPFCKSPLIAPKWRVMARAPKWRAKVERYHRPTFIFLCFISNEGMASVIKGACTNNWT